MATYRVGVWAAVSSRAQAGDDKSSLEDQESIGRRFSEAVGGQVVATYLVPGHSRDLILWADACAAMPAYAQFYADLQAHRIDVLHALSADRLGRDAALVAQMYSLASKYDCEIYLANAPHVLGQQTVASRIVPAVLGIQAQGENEAKVHRQKQGMRRRVLKEGLIGCHTPYGYRPVYENGRTVGFEFDEHAETMRLMTQHFLQGMPYTRIVHALNALGLPGPDGGHWCYASVRRMLHNDTYAGMPRWSRQQRSEPSDAYPALWDAETHKAMVRERARRKTSGYIRHGAGPFTGVAFCRRCGKRLTRAVYAGYIYLRCSTYVEFLRGNVSDRCHRNGIQERRIAEAVEAFFAELTEEKVRGAYLKYRDPTRDLRGDLARAQAELSSLHAQRERLALAFAAGKMKVDIYSTTDGALLAQETMAAERVRELETEIAAQPDVEASVQDLLWLRDNLSAVMAEADPASVATILQNTGLRVLVEENKVVEICTN